MAALSACGMGLGLLLVRRWKGGNVLAQTPG
jgi:hypothetical protein